MFSDLIARRFDGTLSTAAAPAERNENLGLCESQGDDESYTCQFGQLSLDCDRRGMFGGLGVQRGDLVARLRGRP